MAALEDVVAFSAEKCWHYRARHQGRTFWFENDILEFDRAIPKYFDLIRDSLVKLGVPENKVFPPDWDLKYYHDRLISWRFLTVTPMMPKKVSLFAKLLRDSWKTDSSLRSRIVTIAKMLKVRVANRVGIKST